MKNNLLTEKEPNPWLNTDLTRLGKLADRFKMNELNFGVALREDFSEDDEFETSEALIFIEAILNNLVYDLEYQGEEHTTYQLEKHLIFEGGKITGKTLLEYVSLIQNSVDSIRLVAQQIDTAAYAVSAVDLIWDQESLGYEMQVQIIVVLQNGTMPLIDVPCNLLSLPQWHYQGITVNLDNFIPDSRTSGYQVPFAHIGSTVYMRSYLALTYLLNKQACNPNLIGIPANDPNGSWILNYEIKEWKYVCGGPSNPHWGPGMLWTSPVTPPYGAPFQSRISVIDEYNYIISLVNSNKPNGKDVVSYVVREGIPCRASNQQIIRRSHELLVQYGNWVYVPVTVNQ